MTFLYIHVESSLFSLCLLSSRTWCMEGDLPKKDFWSYFETGLPSSSVSSSLWTKSLSSKSTSPLCNPAALLEIELESIFSLSSFSSSSWPSGNTSLRSWEYFSRKDLAGRKSPRSSFPRNSLNLKGLLKPSPPYSSVQESSPCRVPNQNLNLSSLQYFIDSNFQVQARIT